MRWPSKPDDDDYNIHRGSELALELTDADGLDGTGYSPALPQRHLYGDAVDEILAVEDAAGDLLWGLADHEGTIRDIVDSSGVVQEHRQYDTFGQITSPANPTADFPQAFTGRPFDADTGLGLTGAKPTTTLSEETDIRATLTQFRREATHATQRFGAIRRTAHRCQVTDS